MGIETHRLKPYQEPQPLRDRPRLPHIPHARALTAAVILAVAGTAASGTFIRNNESSPPDIKPGLVSQEDMRFPYGVQPVNLSVSPAGEQIEDWTTVPQVLEGSLVSNNFSLSVREDISIREVDQLTITISKKTLENAHLVPILGAAYKERVPGDFGEVTLGPDGPHGGIYFKLTEEDGTPIPGPNGNPVFVRGDQVESLKIPEQIQVSEIA